MKTAPVQNTSVNTLPSEEIQQTPSNTESVANARFDLENQEEAPASLRGRCFAKIKPLYENKAGLFASWCVLFCGIPVLIVYLIYKD